MPTPPAYVPSERGPQRAGLATVPTAVVARSTSEQDAGAAPMPRVESPAVAETIGPELVATVIAIPGRGPDDVAPFGDEQPDASDPAQPVSVAAAPATSGPLTANERRAELAAYRAFLHARQRRFSQARAAFAEAALLDPHLALEATPGFWDLERSAHEAAVAAYADAGRDREGAYLASRLRTMFRPRLVSAPIG